jgi:GGDEF domain-containing protein
MISDETLTILSQLVGKSVTRPQAEDLFVTLNQQNATAPTAMISSLIENLQIQYNAIANPSDIEPVFSDILARDRYTGYYIHAALRTLYLDMALVRSGQPGQENRNFLILGDYMNLSSVNDAIGRTTTNDVMATICGIYLDCMTRAGVVDWLYHRSMGDEVTFVILNTDSDKVLHGLDEARRITDNFVHAMGLENLNHKKYPDRTGAGLVTACITLKNHMDNRLLKKQLDAEIHEAKKARPARKTWFGFSRHGIDPEQFHNRASETRVDKALHKYRHYRTAIQQTQEAETKTPGRNALNASRSLLVGRAIAWPRDDRIDYLHKHHDNTKVILRSDIYNLGGLNTTFGHDGADQIKAHLVRILYATIASHDVTEPKIFDCGGGIIDMVINAMPPFHLHKMVQAIQSNIYYQILSHRVVDYANAYNLSFSGDGACLLGALPHPRHENSGTGLVMATHNVETGRSLPEIIERVDKITHRTKMHNFAYLWHDERDHVFGLVLNQPPEPVNIGPDRLNTTEHYLPFTDALRQYLHEDDLPGIFERPVGQICEILFGTDMQAVLGFKKAIRMLQEKQIGDDIIDGIASYSEMDARMKAGGLPPLSVVSTQNRPALVLNERESFRTMALAEKLEGLPKTLSSLVLQAQACFRTLKIIQPHGRMPTEQAAQILIEEIGFSSQQTAGLDALYALTRLLDRSFTTLYKDMPDDLRSALRDYALENLRDLALAFESVHENALSQKVKSFVWKQVEHPRDRVACLAILDAHIPEILEKMDKKHALDARHVSALQERLEGLVLTLKKMAKTPDIMWSVTQ